MRHSLTEVGPTTNATMSKRIAHFVVAFRFLWFEYTKIPHRNKKILNTLDEERFEFHPLMMTEFLVKQNLLIRKPVWIWIH